MSVINTYLYKVDPQELAELEVLAERFLICDEVARWRRFRHVPSQQMFLAGRFLLRAILAQTLGCAAIEVPLQLSDRGKPYLAGASGSFNLSHSHGWVLLALSSELDLGVDIERADSGRDLTGLARVVMAPDELELFEAQEVATRENYFFQLWSAKEALVKLLGAGIGHGLEKIQLTPALTAFRSPYDAYRLLRLNAPPGFHAALVYARRETETLTNIQQHTLTQLQDCLGRDGSSMVSV